MYEFYNKTKPADVGPGSAPKEPVGEAPQPEPKQ